MKDTLSTIDQSFSVRQLAKRWRVSVRKVREMIRRGQLRALNVGGRRSMLRVTPEAVRACEELLTVPATLPRQRRRVDSIDPEIAKLLGW